MSKHKPRVLIVSHDVVGTQMAGPGIRYYHMARVLADEITVTLAAPAPILFESPPVFDTLPYSAPDDPQLALAIEQASVVIVPAIWVSKIPVLQKTSTPIVIDAYNPFVMESLARGEQNISLLQQALAVAYLHGDFFICASEQQRDWLLGILEAYGRVNTSSFSADNTLRQLVDVVPYGLPKHIVPSPPKVIKGVWDGISVNDYVLLWGGGLWKWLDPLTAIKAVGEIWRERRDVRLIFPGTKHPNREIPESLTLNREAKNLARKLNLYGKAVFFGDWIPYKNWGKVLAESDIALSLHFDSIETHFAYRSRILEYISADLPVITTRGAATSDLIEQHKLGYVVDYQDVQGVANAIRFTLNELPYRQERFRLLKETLSWEQVLQPLVKFCQNPHHAPDKTGDATIGSAFYLSQISQLQTQIENYEKGKFIRFMRWLKGKR